MRTCPRCELEMVHCHGTLVRHDDGGRECTVEGCVGDPVGHDFVLACADVWAGCCTGGTVGAVGAIGHAWHVPTAGAA